MEQGYKEKRIAIIGSGASGCLCAYFLLNVITPSQYSTFTVRNRKDKTSPHPNPPPIKGGNIEITLFDKGAPLRTLLPTGGGRCNLAHAEFNSKELASNYPRGEKFLYSVFSQYSTSDTLETFENMGIETYIQENGRIFPKSNSAKDVRNVILSKIRNADFVREEVVEIEVIDGGFKIKTCPPSSGFQPPSPLTREKG